MPLASRRHGARCPTLKQHPEVHARQLPERLQPDDRRNQHRECYSQHERPEPDHRFDRRSCGRKKPPDEIFPPDGKEEPQRPAGHSNEEGLRYQAHADLSDACPKGGSYRQVGTSALCTHQKEVREVVEPDQ